MIEDWEERRSMNELDRLPWWVRTIALVGVPALISCGLTYFITIMMFQDVKNTATNTALAIRNHEIIISNEKDILLKEDYLLRGDELIEKYLYALCMNSSKSAEQVARCNLK